MVLVKSVQAKRDCRWFTASSMADGGRTTVGHHQAISGRGTGWKATTAFLHTRKFFWRICVRM